MRINKLIFMLAIFISILGCGSESEESFIKYGILYASFEDFNSREEKFNLLLDSSIDIVRINRDDKRNMSNATKMNELYVRNQESLSRDIALLDTINVTSDLKDIHSNFKKYLRDFKTFSQTCFPLDIKMISNRGVLSDSERTLMRTTMLNFKSNKEVYVNIQKGLKKYFNDNDLSIQKENQ